MKPLRVARPGEKASVLCIGAHSDDIEIGVGGTILEWIAAGLVLDVHWCVLSAAGMRAEEARASAESFLKGASNVTLHLAEFRDSYFPYEGGAIKEWMAQMATQINPDVIFTHRSTDAHQDHREISQITSNIFRDHLILEYEVPKWDGDLERSNIYVPLTEHVMERKIELLLVHFGSQRSKDWFDSETFRGLARLRGLECRAPGRYAEAFSVKKMMLL
jgi:LmbE family N-acetylglucosaminyl deacetylase